MSRGKPEEGRMSGVAVTFTHCLLNTHITALSVKEKFVFIGEGQHCHAHDVLSGKQVSSTQVFCAAVVHGLSVQLGPENDGSYLLLVFGQKSLAVLLFSPTQEELFVLLEERRVEDWIVDAGLEKNLAHVVIATSHNSLLRCEIPDLSVCCKILSRKTSGDELHSCQVTKKSRPVSVVSDIHTSDRKGHLSIVAQAACVERCVLFSGHLVMMTGCWESAVMMAGTMALQVMIWGPWATKDSEGKALPLHCLEGHQGSIFSITFSFSQGLIATTSDDRSLRVWEVRHEAKLLPPTNPEEEQEYWRSATITEKFASYGHRARVWRSLILPSWIISVGEDSLVCVWEHSGTLAASWSAHDGASIWSVVACEDPLDRLITGSSDGSVKSWCLNAAAPIVAKLMSDLPWNNKYSAEKCSAGTTNPVKDNITTFNNSKTEDYNVPESHELFEDNCTEIPSLRTNPLSVADFPRCISLVAEDMVLVITNSGKLYSHNPETFWHLEYEDKRFKNYAIMEANPDGSFVAVGTLGGTMVILQVAGRSVKPEVEVVGSSGKVFALQWLTMSRILVLGTAGLMTTWEMQSKDKSTNYTPACRVSTHYLPVSMHRWLCAVYVSPIVTKAVPQHLVCGDRAGSLHLYTLNEPKPQHSLHGVHGKNGVTAVLCWHGGLVYSSGRDGYVRSLRVSEGRLLSLTATRVSGSSWVSRLIAVKGKLLAICFYGVKLKLWSVGEEQTLLEVECGGAHRSWDLRLCGKRGWLVCTFLKDGTPYTFSTPLNNKMLPHIRPALHTQETMELRLLFQHRREMVLLTAGEDTTLRLHALHQQGQRQSFGVVRSHLSGVRALCLIEETHGTKSDSDTVWLISAGGRAELKVWECSISEFSNLANNSDCDLCCCEVCALPSDDASLESDSCRLQPQSVILREVGSHMLRTGCHRDWKRQHLTLDPETRYMGATAFWVSSSQAVVALASSDGFLRIFFVLRKCEKVREACAVECGSCVLSVAQLKVVTGTILVTCSTNGHITFWDLQAVVDWSLSLTGSEDFNHQPHQPPQPQEITFVAAHQSGINAITFHYNIDDPSCIIMATGGDDNTISMWKVVVMEDAQVTVTRQCSVVGHASQVSGLGWLSKNYLISASIDQRLIVWNFNKKDGILWKDPMRFCNATSEDRATEEHQLLIPVGCRFIGVPDVKGLIVTDVDETENMRHNSHRIDKRVFVYGMGLQVFDVSVASL
ncbi:WD repeat-containing protein 6-like isoform X3 [Portunus trituberculatus]|uniref:WD repeat-containing protein 6-like isoform X3 n=1 Tax=Portunus trituberculatus TaxID=210409 RepID=UPI001E1CFFF3|nr:WD repeat-containing protein 6-like isoform X3 [Portunus trituberculatus]